MIPNEPLDLYVTPNNSEWPPGEPIHLFMTSKCGQKGLHSASQVPALGASVRKRYSPVKWLPYHHPVPQELSAASSSFLSHSPLPQSSKSFFSLSGRFWLISPALPESQVIMGTSCPHLHQTVSHMWTGCWSTLFSPQDPLHPAQCCWPSLNEHEGPRLSPRVSPGIPEPEATSLDHRVAQTTYCIPPVVYQPLGLNGPGKRAY